VLGGECVESCPTGTVAANGDPNCRACNSECIGGCVGLTSSNCTACRTARYNGACIAQCPLRTTLNTATLQCESCSAQCSDEGCFGTSAVECRSCANLRFGDLCVSACPVGHYVDYAEGLCVECDPECVDCTGPGSFACGSCVHFTDVTVEGTRQCMSACSSGTFVLSGTTCVAQCPPATPYYADTRVTGEPVAACAATCSDLNDTRLDAMHPSAPFRCTTSDMVATDSANGGGNDATSDSAFMWIAVAIAAAFVVIALVVAVAVTTRRRKGSAELEQDRHRDLPTPSPLSPGLVESMHTSRRLSDSSGMGNTASSPSSFYNPVYVTPPSLFANGILLSHQHYFCHPPTHPPTHRSFASFAHAF